MLEQLREQHIDLDSAHPIAIAMRTGQLQRVDSIDESAAALLDQDSTVPRRCQRVGRAVRRSWRRCGRAAGCWARSRSLRSASAGSATTTCGSCASSRAEPPSPWTTRACTEETNYIADRLQRSLLPPHLPEIRGVEIATRFRPAGDRNDVGGDFYDIFQTGPNRWAITIGDVCGKGPDAAAVTALARHTLRATAIRGDDSPDELLRALNDAMLVDNPTDFQFCTVAFAGLEVGDGSNAAGSVERRAPAPDRAARRTARSSPSANRARCSASFPTRTSRAPRSSCSAATRSSSTRTGSPRRAPRRGCSAHEGLLKALRACAGCDAAEIAERIEQSMLDVQTGGPARRRRAGRRADLGGRGLGRARRAGADRARASG